MEFLAKKDNGLIQRNHSRIGFHPIVFLAKWLKIWFPSSALFRSVLKVNEFTLAGAVLADSLGRGAGKKEKAGSRLTPRLKARHFQKNTIARDMHNCSALRHAQGPYKGTIIPGGYSTPRVHYAHATHGQWRVIVLFSLLKLSKFQIEDKSKTQRVHPCSALVQSFLKTKKAWS